MYTRVLLNSFFSSSILQLCALAVNCMCSALRALSAQESWSSQVLEGSQIPRYLPGSTQSKSICSCRISTVGVVSTAPNTRILLQGGGWALLLFSERLVSLLRLWISVHRVLSSARVSCRFTRTSTDSSRVLLMASAGPAIPPAVSDPATAQSDLALATSDGVDYSV